MGSGSGKLTKLKLPRTDLNVKHGDSSLGILVNTNAKRLFERKRTPDMFLHLNISLFALLDIRNLSNAVITARL